MDAVNVEPGDSWAQKEKVCSGQGSLRVSMPGF